MNYSRTTSLMLLFVSAGFAADSATARFQAICKQPQVKSRHTVTFNATTGERIDGSLRFPQVDDVAVIFKKNPFKYSYKIGVVTTPLESAIASDFLRMVPGLGALIDGALGKVSPTAAGALPAAAPAAPPAACSGIDISILSQSAVIALTVESQAIKAELAKLKSANDDYERFVAATDTETLDDPCSFCDLAGRLSDEIGGLVDVSKLAARIAKFQKEVEPHRSKIEAIAKAEACAKALGDEFTAIGALPKDADTYAAAIKKIQDNKAGYETMQKILKAALASDQAFWEVRYPQTAGDATDVTINVTVKNLRAAEAQAVPLTPIHLTIGESRIKLTAGIGFSTLNDVKIVRQPSVGADNAIASRFGYENKAPFKPSGVVMLNAPLVNWRHVSFGLNTGLVIVGRDDNAQFEYTAGGSLGFLRNLVFLNAGFHTGRVERLGGGFQMGSLIPKDLPDPIPTEKNWAYGAMISITFRIR